MVGAPRAAQARALYPRALDPSFWHPLLAGFCHPSFTPACLPACSRCLRGSVDLDCGSPCRGKCLGRLWSSEKVTRPASSQLRQGPLSPAVLASLLVALAGLRRCPFPKGPGNWHLGEGAEAHQAPYCGQGGGRLKPSPTQERLPRSRGLEQLKGSQRLEMEQRHKIV